MLQWNIAHLLRAAGMSASSLVFYGLVLAAIAAYVQILLDINDELYGP